MDAELAQYIAWFVSEVKRRGHRAYTIYSYLYFDFDEIDGHTKTYRVPWSWHSMDCHLETHYKPGEIYLSYDGPTHIESLHGAGRLLTEQDIAEALAIAAGQSV